MFKNVTTTAASVAGGSVGRGVGSVVGSMIFPIPKIGAFLGGLAGAALGSYVQDYLITEEEAKVIMNEVSAIIDEDFLKDMYASYDREIFVEYAIENYFIDTVCAMK